MKTVYLAAGAASMYCGSCLHDNTLAAALKVLGEDVLLVPTYTPLRTDEENVSDSHLFFGGINVYLQQRSSLFRHTPWFIDALLDRPGVIRLATRGGPSVEAAELGDLTVSMLEGEHGRQRKEIRKLVHWLKREAQPGLVHLSNAMLLGMAREIGKLGVPVVCSLSGEDIFLEKLVEPYYSQARAALRERAADVSAFVALNHYYADYMAEYLAIDRSKIRVIPHGLNLEGHAAPGSSRNGLATNDRTFTIGYMARICPDKGLHNLIAAAELMQADRTLPPFRIRAAGYLSKLDRPYLETIVRRTSQWKHGAFEYVGELNRSEKIAFLQSLQAMSLPTVYRESKGLSVFEAMANGVSVVLPDHGTFPEVVRDTGGGLLHQADSPAALAESLSHLLRNPSHAAELGGRGQRAVHERYHARNMAEMTRDLYRQVVSGAPVG